MQEAESEVTEATNMLAGFWSVVIDFMTVLDLDSSGVSCKEINPMEIAALTHSLSNRDRKQR